MICDIGTPSAAERSLTVTPDSTVTGPVGWTGACFGRRRRLRGAVARLAAVAAARVAALDHDAAAAACLAAAARADRAVRLVRVRQPCDSSV